MIEREGLINVLILKGYSLLTSKKKIYHEVYDALMLCNLLCGIVILLLIIAGIAYLMGADRMGEFALDLIRIIIVVVLIVILLALVLFIIGYISWEGLPIDTSLFSVKHQYKDLLTPFLF